MKKIKVLFVVESMSTGVFSYLTDLSNLLINYYEVYVAYGLRKETPKDIENYFDSRVRLIRVKNFQRQINPIADSKAIIEIKKIAKNIQPDIIHLHSTKAGFLGRFAFNSRQTPIFYTPHGYLFLKEENNFLKKQIFRSAEWIAAKRGAITISCGPGEQQESSLLTKNAIEIDNGIDIKSLNGILKKVKTKGHIPTVFTSGRISYQKNPTLFNQIAQALPQIKFVWIGDGDLVETLTSPNIEVKGWLSRKEALAITKNSDIFLLPSRWEGLSMSLLESMYMKKLCIVSDISGNNDVIINEKNGYICKNVNEYVSAIVKGFDNQAVRNNLVNCAYNDIVNHYNMDFVVKEYRKNYEKELKMKDN